MPPSADDARAQDDRKPDLVRAFSKTVDEEPEALYARLRRECPVALQHGTAGSSGATRSAWLITRHEDIVATAQDTETFGQNIRWPDARRPPLEADPPEHGPIRALMQPFFMPRALAAFEPMSREIAVELLDPILAAGHGDLASGVCRPLPAQVLLARLGQPREDWPEIKDACEAVYLQGSPDPDDLAKYAAANDFLWAYSRRAVAERQASPRPVADDMVSAMLAGRPGSDGVAPDLVAGVVRLMVAAGHDSTTSAMGICLRRVVEDQDIQDRLRAEPGLIASAVEEMLRLEAPVLQMPRVVKRDVELGGRQLRKGDQVLLVFASGNRDEAAFEDVEACVLDRMPNRHLSFGTGIHTCIGNGLARQEIRVALQTLLCRTRRVTLTEPAEREFWHPYGAVSLKVECVPA